MWDRLNILVDVADIRSSFPPCQHVAFMRELAVLIGYV